MRNLKDVIIIGAGPAGAIAAKTIAKNGHSVLIIDKKNEIGYPVQCAEAVSRSGLEGNNIQIQKEWLKLQLTGLKIYVPDGKYFFFLEDVFCIDRQKFDCWLNEEALKNGCEILLNTNIDSIKREDGLWHVSSGNKLFKSKILVGADGPQSSVAKWLGILRKREFINGINYKFSKDDINLQEDKLLIFYNSEFKGGYVWIFPRGDEYNIGIGGTEDFDSIKKALDKFCKSKYFDVTKKKSMSTGIIPINYELDRFTKNSAIIVGDAAGLVNPLFGSGISSALFSGRTAGKVICKALESNDFSLLNEYETILRNHPICNPVLNNAREILYSFNDNEWNFIGDIFYRQDWRKVSFIKILYKFISKPGFLFKIRKFWTAKKGIGISAKYGW